MSQPEIVTKDLGAGELGCATWIARFLKARGVDRVFGLQGGHIQPIWDRVARIGIRIIDVRDEGAAVHMAHAHAELTGTLGVAMVTAGPGVTNTVTAIANASLARVPVLLIGGCPATAQANMGPLQDIPHVDILGPVTRTARTARIAEQVIRELDEAVARAEGDEPGPVYVEIPTDVLRSDIAPGLVLDDWMKPKLRRVLHPDPAAIAEAVDVVWSARRPLVITGRGARGADAALVRFLDASGAFYLDTQESRGLVRSDHPAFAGAVRAAAMADADAVVVIGRRLDYQLGYGSPAVFPQCPLRPYRQFHERADRQPARQPGDPRQPCARTRCHGRGGRKSSAQCRSRHGPKRCDAVSASAQGRSSGGATLGGDGKIHPRCIFDAIAEVADPDYIAIADGGDLLSFARIGLAARTYMDAGAFGCLGVGVPFAIAAALAFPGRQVISVNGDGAFGINAMEIDTAVRHDARAVFIVSNNAAWNIERL